MPGGARDPGADRCVEHRVEARLDAGSRSGSASTPARSSPATLRAARCSPRATRSCSATRSTSPRGSSRPPQPGEVLIGEATYRLVRGAVQVEPVAPIAAKGKSEPLTAYRLLEVSAHGPLPRRAGDAARRPRRRARAARGRVRPASAEGCRLVTVVGEAGVGKSRLTAELAAAIGDRARIVRGACLSYGEGITYWPIAQIVRELAGIRDDDTAEQVRERVPPRIAQLLGLTEGTVTRRAARRGDRRARRRGRPAQPLVLLDRRHPLGRAGAARPARAAAGADRGLRPLALPRPARAARRPARLAGHGEARAARGRRDRRAAREPRCAGGDAASGSRTQPPATRSTPRSSSPGCARAATSTSFPTSLNALLGARLDRLEPGERDALERGAVEGELFHQGAVVELSGKPVARRARRALPQGHDPARGRQPRRRADRVPLQAHPRPRRRLPRHHQEAPRDAARALRRLARAARRRSRRRVPRDPRLPPRAGLPLPRRARRCGRDARDARRPPSRRGGRASPPTCGLPRLGEPGRASGRPHAAGEWRVPGSPARLRIRDQPVRAGGGGPRGLRGGDRARIRAGQHRARRARARPPRQQANLGRSRPGPRGRVGDPRAGARDCRGAR